MDLKYVLGLLVVLPAAVLLGLMPARLPALPHVEIKTLPDHLYVPKNVTKPFEGALAHNEALKAATVVFNGTISGSETVQVDSHGTMWLIDRWGFVHAAQPDASAPGGYRLHPKPLAHLGGGRPLGFKFHPNGDLYVCSTGVGLVKVEGLQSALQGGDAAAVHVVLVGQRVSEDSPLDPGSEILFADDLDITHDGSVVYFSDAQDIPVLPNYDNPKKPWYDALHSHMLGVLSGQASGRLLAYYTNNGSIHVISKGLWFANGVALSGDESFVAVAETNMFRVMRHWLKGPKAGSTDTLVDGLPGFPDGVSTARDGNGIWIAIAAPRTGLWEVLKHRAARVLLAQLPRKWAPHPEKWTALIKVDNSGKITQFLESPHGGSLSGITAVEEVKLPSGRGAGSSRLLMGFLEGHHVAYIDV